MFQECSECELLVLSEFVSEKSEGSQKNVLDDEWVFQSFFGGFLLSVRLDKGSETKGVSAVDFLLEESGEFGDTFEFSDLVFENLVSHDFEELFLLSSFVFDFLFNDFGQLSGELLLVGN